MENGYVSLLRKNNMRTFFAEHKNISDTEIVLGSEDYNHIKNVLRFQINDTIRIGSGDNIIYNCQIREFYKDTVICDIISEEKCESELPVEVFIFQGLPKLDKMELVIQKSVELGAYGIVPVEMDRCVVRVNEDRAKKKHERWQQIGLAASRQSGRSSLPCVESVHSFEQALDAAREFDHILVPYECADGFSYTRNVFNDIKKNDRVAVFIGPEGGFSGNEIDCLKTIGAKIFTLGKRILRTETAPIMIMSVFTYLFEEG